MKPVAHRYEGRVAQVDQHDEEFTRFVIGARPALRRTAFRITTDWYEADDLVQRTLLALYRRWGTLERRDQLAAYAHKTMVRLAIGDRRTRRWSSEVLQARPPEPDPIPDAHAVIGNRLLLMDILAGLGPRQRAALVLRYWEDCQIEEIANLLGCLASTVRSQIARGLANLRSELEPEGTSEDARHRPLSRR